MATEYWRKLYEKPVDAEAEEFFITNFDKSITDDQRNELKQSITLEDLYEHLKEIKKSTTPGSDGTTYETIYIFWDRLGPSLTKVANAIMEKGKLPHSMKQILISLIPKKDKVLKTVDNHRPISVINCGLRLICSYFESKLQPIIQ
ncbi:uncharacterized protein KGF55_003065 [Candida pseudojiufengensis]|uniref:uncharacterized protein n=1 Tax=Candida pseudojiufengensis TaxID=497109 RepID=UPI0022248604|nr:uncharacterized protein KGF55_003065 [Candida pseudojiufengensis]KAI5963273.1 hypothetical protein KGF55_003065 [Candida pseudojiufengensis]